MRNIYTIMFSTSVNSESNVSAVIQITDIPDITSITSSISQSTINKLKVTAWEEIPQSNIGCISTITSIRHNNSPNSNIINKVLILITGNVNRNINNRNRINSQISIFFSTVRTCNSHVIGQITKGVDCLIVIGNVIYECTVVNQITHFNYFYPKSYGRILASNVGNSPGKFLTTINKFNLISTGNEISTIEFQTARQTISNIQ